MGILVFDMNVRGNIQRVVTGEPVGTAVVRDTEQTRFAS
jgi:uridylate kinase